MSKKILSGTELSRRAFLKTAMGAAGAGGAAMLLVGCTPKETAAPTAAPVATTAASSGATSAPATAAPVAATSAPTTGKTLVVLGPRTPESVDYEAAPTVDRHDACRNVCERLLEYKMVQNADGVWEEDFSTIEGGLAETWVVSDDYKSITFNLRKGVVSHWGNELTADSVKWTFDRGWEVKANYYWYFTNVLKIESPSSWEVIDKYTIKVTIPNPSPLLDRIWINNDFGIADAEECKKHITSDDPWASEWMATNAGSFAPYWVEEWSPGQQVVYAAHDKYYRGPAKISKVIFREVPNTANRVALLQGGTADVAEWLTARELDQLRKLPSVTVKDVFGNYIYRVEMQNKMAPFDNKKVRQALNYAVPREDILTNVFYNQARLTKSPVSEIYPGYTDKHFFYTYDLDKAKQLLTEAGLADGFETHLAYRAAAPEDEEVSVLLKDSFSKIGVNLVLDKMPAAELSDRAQAKHDLPMYFFLDMAIVPDAAYVNNLWLNSKSLINYSQYYNPEVDKLIDNGLSSIDEPQRLKDMGEVQRMVMDDAPWLFLVNPGYHLAFGKNCTGMSWRTPNCNAWYDWDKS